jgi:hypothetical protein
MARRMSKPSIIACVLLQAVCMLVGPASQLWAQSEEAPANDDLAVEQGQLADRFDRLEMVLSQLAELLADKDPQRARLLREAIVQSRQQDINIRFEATVRLLEQERLAAASSNQVELQSELEELLKLLLREGIGDQRSEQQKRIREYLAELSRLLRMQKGIRARTESGEKLDGLGADQKDAAGRTGKLAKEISETECEVAGDQSDSSKSAESGEGEKQSKPGSKGSPSEAKPSKSSGEPSESSGGESSPGESQESEQRPESPADKAVDRLQRAQEQMQRAIEELEKAERDQAEQSQRQAQRNLEQAKAELERILRQLREEELEQKLMLLAARFRRMLDLQLDVYEGTLKIDKVPESARGHEQEIVAVRLGRTESVIVQEADKALILLREEGSSVAFPEVIEQMRGDMEEVATRLTAVDVGKITQGLEEDIIEALEEAIAALEKALEDLEKKRQQGGQMPGDAEMTEPPLVEKLAELKMIRSLQMRINKRTRRYGQMMEQDQGLKAELEEAMEDLASRQERVHKATYDLGIQRNE